MTRTLRRLFGGRSKKGMTLVHLGLPDPLLGTSTLLDEVFWWVSFDVLWSLFIIAIGILIVSNTMRR